MYYQVDFDEQICCDLCCEVVHFHIDKCPVCLTTHASTDQYHSVIDCINDEDSIFICTHCDTSFKILKYDYCDEPQATIEIYKG